MNIENDTYHRANLNIYSVFYFWVIIALLTHYFGPSDRKGWIFLLKDGDKHRVLSAYSFHLTVHLLILSHRLWNSGQLS